MTRTWNFRLSKSSTGQKHPQVSPGPPRMSVLSFVLPLDTDLTSVQLLPPSEESSTSIPGLMAGEFAVQSSLTSMPRIVTPSARLMPHPK